ncbi:hypothetical protein OE424_34620 [Pseudomonas aeruginosa]|uniref:hypothetical protein n=1 Tax=Pseudomonas aeruginosa TaxID=287 RepID=UPI001495D3CA|nr:hypothetical protein [Pseudomonas aeruginosa]MBH9516749.1 hypothetical protein [Pseudomonas aeruginosa]MCU9212130.1 hypothetical protein [Pseudomonas aeruginosa]HCE6123138.1 hypothetical protein [Pseudomonas aeruginosa]
MFLTYQAAKVDQFALFGDDPAAWSYVEHNIHRPWFYVAAMEQGDDFPLHPMLMLSSDQLLQSLVRCQEDGLLLESVLLVSPDHVNKSGRWMMEPLEAIFRYESPDGVAYVYQVSGNRSYICGDGEVATQDRARREMLFSTSMLSATS